MRYIYFYLSNWDPSFLERLPTRWPHLRLLASADAMSIDRVNFAGVAHHQSSVLVVICLALTTIYGKFWQGWGTPVPNLEWWGYFRVSLGFCGSLGHSTVRFALELFTILVAVLATIDDAVWAM